MNTKHSVLPQYFGNSVNQKMFPLKLDINKV